MQGFGGFPDSGPSLATHHASRFQLKCPHNTARPGQHADRSRNVTIERFHTIQSVISPRRRVRGPGLQKLVGRVPSRGATFDVVYKTGYNGSLAVGQAACQPKAVSRSLAPPELGGPDSSASLLWHRFPMIFAAPLRPPRGRLEWRGTGLRDTQVRSWEWNFPKVGRGKHFLSDFVFGGF